MLVNFRRMIEVTSVKYGYKDARRKDDIRHAILPVKNNAPLKSL